MTATQTIWYAVSKTTELDTVDLSAPFMPVMALTADELAVMAGTPAAVMLAQTLCYIKHNYKLREEVQATNQEARKLLALAMTVPLPKK